MCQRFKVHSGGSLLPESGRHYSRIVFYILVRSQLCRSNYCENFCCLHQYLILIVSVLNIRNEFHFVNSHMLITNVKNLTNGLLVVKLKVFSMCEMAKMF